MKRKISVFGNPDLSMDSLPLEILPELQKHLPDISFVVEDPNELDLPEEQLKEWMIIDTVQGLKKVRCIPYEEIAKESFRVAAHDYDLSTHLQLVHKLRPDLNIQIIGVPMHSKKEQVFNAISSLLDQRKD